MRTPVSRVSTELRGGAAPKELLYMTVAYDNGKQAQLYWMYSYPDYDFGGYPMRAFGYWNTSRLQ